MTEKTRPAPYLMFNFGLLEGQRVELNDTRVILGRDSTADIQLKSAFVSREHALLQFESGCWWVTDLNSKNGVFINAGRIEPGQPARLRHGDQVQIGSACACTFQDPEATIHESDLRPMSSGLWLDQANRDVYVYNRRLNPPLSEQQFSLLSAIYGRSGDVITNQEIEQVLWPGAREGLERAAIDNLINRLRQRLSELEPGHCFIETVRGVGRRFCQKSLRD